MKTNKLRDELLEKLNNETIKLDKANEIGDIKNGTEYFNNYVDLSKELMRIDGIEERRNGDRRRPAKEEV